VSVPEPDIVTLPAPVTFPEIVVLPTPAIVRSLPDAVVTAVAFDSVSVSASLTTDALAPSVIAPVIKLSFVPVASRLRIAPVVEIPVPEIVNASPTDKLAPLMCTAAPEATVVAPAVSPRAELLLTTITPASTEVAPVNVLTADNVNVPVPDFVNVPEPVVIAAIDEVPTLSTVNPMSVPVTPPDNVNDDSESICTSDADVNNVTTPVIVCEPLVLRIAPLVDTPEPVISIGSATVKVPDNDNAALFATVVLPRESPFLPSAVLLLIATTPVEIVVSPVYVLAFDNANVPTPVFFVNVPKPEITPDNV